MPQSSKGTARTQENSSLIARRQLLIGAAAYLVFAPAVVHAVSLMPVRGIFFPTERYYFGFVDRLYVHSNLPTITALQNAGLSAHKIATEMTTRHMLSMNGAAWDARTVMGVIKRNELIRRMDMILRAERQLSAG